LRVNLLDGYSKRTTSQRVAAGRAARRSLSLRNAGGWYDVRVTLDGVAGFEIHSAGHVENGAGSISDPLLSGDPA
jgi:phospholipase C